MLQGCIQQAPTLATLATIDVVYGVNHGPGVDDVGAQATTLCGDEARAREYLAGRDADGNRR